MKVTRYESKEVRLEDRDLLVVEAVEGIRQAERWWSGRQSDSFVVALRDREGKVSVFDTVLRRAVELDAEEAASVTNDDLRALLDRAVARTDS